MRVIVEEERSFQPAKTSLSGLPQRNFQVIITDGRKKEVVTGFSSPGNFADGYLSDHQAKSRAHDLAKTLTETLISMGAMERPVVQSAETAAKRNHKKAPAPARLLAAE